MKKRIKKVAWIFLGVAFLCGIEFGAFWGSIYILKHWLDPSAIPARASLIAVVFFVVLFFAPATFPWSRFD